MDGTFSIGWQSNLLPFFPEEGMKTEKKREV